MDRKEYQKQWARARRLLLRSSNDSDTSSNSDDDAPIDPEPIRPTDVPSGNDTVSDLDSEDDMAIDNPDHIAEGVPQCAWEDIHSDRPPETSESEVEDQYGTSESEKDDYEDRQRAPESFRENIAGWVNSHQIKHNAVDDLLKILKRHGHPELPSTARTLLHTVRNVETKECSGMEYLYMGLADKLRKPYKICKDTVQPTDTGEQHSIDIALNVDGIPVHKDSSKSMWPILCAITSAFPVYVFPVALTYGASKPNNLD